MPSLYFTRILFHVQNCFFTCDMNPANIIYYLSRLFDVDLSLNVKQISETERLAAQQLTEIIRSIISISSNQIDYDNEVTLDFTIERDNCFIEDDFISNTNHNSDSNDCNNEENAQENRNLKNYTMEFMEEVVRFADEKDSSGKRRRSWTSIKHHYRSIPSQNYISRFRECLSQQGTNRQKIQDIDAIVYNKFVKAREQYLPIHDVDIQRWALQAAKETHLNDF